MTVTFACGHRVTVSETVSEPPVCACGERRVSRVEAPTPKFRGLATGPCVVKE